MTITFVSNYLTLHQIPFCEAMYRELGDDFCFVNTEPMDMERISMGWSNKKRYLFEVDLQQSNDLINESDIVIIGSADESLIQDRLKHNKPVIRYSERILKDGRWHMLSPRAIKNMLKTHTRFTNNQIWMLCASAYAAGDYGLFGAYWKKCYKWGYFPDVKFYLEEELLKKKDHTIVHILWCGRFLNWKHPELAVSVAKYLHKKKIPFHMDIIGDGILKEEIQRQIKDYYLEDSITMHGFLTPDLVRRYMERANIFLFTSDFHEGWGAVLNEAMNSGCACVVSHSIGSAPYLIKDGKNGFLYKNGDIRQLCSRVETLARNKKLRIMLGLKAYQTIHDLWNAEVAAKRFILFCKAVKHQEMIPEYKDGPMSHAKFLANHWYHNRRRDD